MNVQSEDLREERRKKRAERNAATATPKMPQMPQMPQLPQQLAAPKANLMMAVGMLAVAGKKVRDGQQKMMMDMARAWVTQMKTMTEVAADLFTMMTPPSAPAPAPASEPAAAAPAAADPAPSH